MLLELLYLQQRYSVVMSCSSVTNVVCKMVGLSFVLMVLISVPYGVAYSQTPCPQDSVQAADAGQSDSVACVSEKTKIYALLKHYNDSVDSKNCNKVDQRTYMVGYDRFKEQFKEPWIGDLLKAIIFR